MKRSPALKPGDPGASSPSYQEILRGDADSPPACMTVDSYVFLGDGDVSKERYYSQAFHDLEMEKMWSKVWQMACREEDIPEVGDHVVYDIGDTSIIVVRSSENDIKGFYNACLHRGTQLRPSDSQGSVPQFRCPFHGFTWDLEGALTDVPCRWDFPHVKDEDFQLPEVKVGTWGGFVFINMDPDCESLEDYLEVVPEHFAEWDLANRYTASHVEKILPCNWKIAQESFMEVLHVEATHPQTMPYIGDVNSQYDVFGERVNRMITPQAVASPLLDGLTEQEIADSFISELAGSPGPGAQEDFEIADSNEAEIPEGKNARHVMADLMRHNLEQTTGVDHSSASIADAIDTTMYQVFPNFMPCGGPGVPGVPTVFRFRPNGNDPDTSIMDMILLYAFPQDKLRPPAASTTRLSLEQSWFDAPELGGLSAIFEQDTFNMPRVHKGMKTAKKPGVTWANYQEIRIRHYHQMLDEYLAS